MGVHVLDEWGDSFLFFHAGMYGIFWGLHLLLCLFFFSCVTLMIVVFKDFPLFCVGECVFFLSLIIISLSFSFLFACIKMGLGRRFLMWVTGERMDSLCIKMKRIAWLSEYI